MKNNQFPIYGKEREEEKQKEQRNVIICVSAKTEGGNLSGL